LIAESAEHDALRNDHAMTLGQGTKSNSVRLIATCFADDADVAQCAQG